MNQKIAFSSPTSWDAPSFVGWRRQYFAATDVFFAARRALQAKADSR